MKKLLQLTSISILISASSFSQVNLDVGLVAAYPFSGNANDTTVNALNGMVTGASLTTDRFGTTNSAYNFTSNYISVPNNSLFNTGDELSVSLWVKLTNSANNQKIIGRTDGPPFATGFILGAQSGTIYPEIWNSNGDYYTMSSGSISSGVWTHLCMTYANSLYLKAYINGVIVDSVAVGPYPVGPNSDPLIIGIAPWNLVNFPVAGAIDDIMIYNREINPDEVMALYSFAVGLHSPTEGKQLNVFPNPSVNGKFNVVGDAQLKAIRVINSLGETIFFEQSLNTKSYLLDLGSVGKGVYYMDILTDDKQVRKEITIY